MRKMVDGIRLSIAYVHGHSSVELELRIATCPQLTSAIVTSIDRLADR